MNHDFHLEDHPLVLATPRIVPPYGWVGHIPFAYLAMDLLRPRCLVELGTHSGNSYLAFCQAVRALDLSCRCTAVDAWQGDAHALHYGEQVYQSLRSRHEPLYGDFSRLLRACFDEAVDQFEDGEIDLLHIDGLHTYEAVRHDFEVWLPKLSDKAVVLLHDTAMHERGFGVAQFFGELSVRYTCFDFQHSHGLGVVVVGARVPAAFAAFMRHATASPGAMRGFFEALAGRLVDADDRPMASVAESQPVVCHLFYRQNDETYDESRMISLPVDAADGVLDLQFRLPAGVQPDYLRVDPADLPGVYGLSGIKLQQGNGLPARHLDGWVGRLGHVNGELLPAIEADSLRITSFDGDPHLEFEVGSALLEEHGDASLGVGIRVEYEIVISDPALHRLLERRLISLSDMQRLGRERVDMQSLVRRFSQQQVDLQEFSRGFSRQQEQLRELANQLSNQSQALQRLDKDVDGNQAAMRSGLQQLQGALQSDLQQLHAATQSDLRQLQQDVDYLASRGFWACVRRIFRRAR